MKILLIIVIVYLFYRMVIRPYKDYKEAQKILRNELIDDVSNALKESIEKTAKENALLKSGKLPTDEEIEKYYKMYLKKVELNDIWNTYTVSYEDFEKRAKNSNIIINTLELDNGEKLEFGKSGGFSYLFEMTSDAFINGKCVRFRDYEGMIKEDEKKELTSETK